MHYQTKRRPLYLPTGQDFRPQGPQAAGSWLPHTSLPTLSPVPGLCHPVGIVVILAPMVQEGSCILDRHPQGSLVGTMFNLEPALHMAVTGAWGMKSGIHLQRSHPTCSDACLEKAVYLCLSHPQGQFRG